MLPHHTPPLATAHRSPVVRTALLVSTLLLGLTAGAVVQAGQAGAILPPRTIREQRIDRVILHLINNERAAHGLHALRMAPRLRLSARRHNVTMARFNEMAHQLPGEPPLATRISNAGYDWRWVGENLGWSSDMTLPGAARLERRMYHEKPPNDDHRLIILSSRFRDVGVDVYMDHKHHKVWLTTDYGKRR